MRPNLKIIRWSLWAATGLILMLVGLYFLLTLIISSERINDLLSARLSRNVEGQARFGELEWHLLPMPGISLRDVEYRLADRLDLSADTLSVYPEILPLLRGRLVIGRVRLQSPSAAITLPSGRGASGEGRPPYQDLHHLSDMLARAPERMKLLVGNGRLSVLRDGGTVAGIHGLSMLIEKDGDVLGADIEGRSDWADHFHLKTEVNAETFVGKGELDVEGLRGAEWERALRPGIEDPVFTADIDLHAGFQSRGRRQVDITFDGSAPSATIRHDGRTLDVDRLSIEGGAQLTPEGVCGDVTRLRLGHPRLNVSGSFFMPHQGGDGPTDYRLSLAAENSDAAALRRAILHLGGDQAADLALLEIIRSGTLIAMTLQTSGESPSALGRIENLRIEGHTTGARIVIPGIDLNLTDVEGRWQFADRVLTVQDGKARTDGIRGYKGRLKLEFREDGARLGLDIQVAADVAHVPPILKKVIPHPSARAELERIKALQGNAAGRLTLYGPLDHLVTEVRIAEFTFSGEHEGLPQPVAVTGGGLTYTREAIELRRVEVRMAESIIEGLGGRIDLSLPAAADLQAAHVRLNWDRLYPWLAGFSGLRERFKHIQEIGGRMTLSQPRLRGPLADPGQWRVTGDGGLSDVTLRSDRLPDRLTITQGTFELLPERFSFADAHIRLLDADIEARGAVSAYLDARPQVDVNAAGVVGDAAAIWLQRVLGLPDELYVRAPITVEMLEAAWRPQAETRLQGAFVLPGELAVEGDLLLGPDGFDLRRLTLADAVSRARLTLRHDAADRYWESSFSGLLANPTLAKLWRKDLIYLERVEGDISARIPAGHLSDTRLRGHLELRNLTPPPYRWGPLRIRRLEAAGERNRLDIRGLALTLDDQNALISGTVDLSGDKIAFDGSLAADELDVKRLAEKFHPPADSESASVKERPAIPAWTARVETAVERLNYANYTLQPLHAVLVLERGRAAIDVTEAELCGISVRGDALWTPGELSIELFPQASDQTLRVAVGCLSGAQVTERIEGTYSVDGRLETHGITPEALTHNLNGEIHLQAEDGRVFNLGEVGFFSNLLTYLRVNNLVTGDLPGLRENDFHYNRIRSEIDVTNGRAVLKEAYVRSDGLNMVADGVIHLATQRLDLTVLVSPLTTVDAIIRRIPIVGRILEGTLVAVPVRVRGPIADPTVVPLSPKAVGERLLGIMERTLETPFTLIEPILPDSRDPDQEPEGDNKRNTELR